MATLTMLRDAFQSTRRALLEWPWVRELRRRAYEGQFAAGAPGCFCGVYDSFEEARLAAPKGKGVGYDQPAMAAMYRDRMDRVYPADYPVLFWLSRCLPGARTLFDFGGHVAIQYYSYRRYLDYPSGMRWVVCDVPEVLKAGRRIAKEQGRFDIDFTERFEEANAADVLLAAGSLQYLDAPFFPHALSSLAARPRHVLVNKLPVHESRQFVTLQDTGAAYHPYTVFERGRFVSAIRGLGYDLVDQWENAELSCRVPFFPEHDVPAYSGFYFRAGG